MLPNDEQESDRLDILHALMLQVLDGKLYLAPISKTPQRVLDLGTGTGIWAIDFGNSSTKRFRLGERLTKLRYNNSGRAPIGCGDCGQVPSAAN
jgi:hypothetical protein